MENWGSLVWQIYIGAWALSDHLNDIQRADAAERRLAEIEAICLSRGQSLQEIEAQFRDLHRVVREEREAVDVRSKPGEVEMRIASIQAQIVKLRQVEEAGASAVKAGPPEPQEATAPQPE